MDQLWAPWRMAYIDSAKDAPDAGGCIFCEKPAADDDGGSYILARNGRAFAILNAFPYNPGHLMVAPFRHVGELEELQADEMADSHELLLGGIRALKRAASPHGFNVGMNVGRVAGAGFPGHLHWHVVPRWNGDTNFMPVVGETRVLPEALEQTYARLKPLFE